MKKTVIIRAAAAILAAVLLYPGYAQAVSAQKAILVDAQTGRIIYEKRADERSLVASTTKIMTALLICEQCNVLEQVRIPKAAVGIEGSSMYLQEGEMLTVQELLYGLMLSSGNDAAEYLISPLSNNRLFSNSLRISSRCSSSTDFFKPRADIERQINTYDLSYAKSKI